MRRDIKWQGRLELHSSIDHYLVVLHTKRRAPATLKVVRQDLTHFVTWWEHTRRRTFDPSLLRHEDLRDWQLARQRDDGAAPATINRGLASLRGYCQWATFSHLLTENQRSASRMFPLIPSPLAHCPPKRLMHCCMRLVLNSTRFFARRMRHC